MRLPSPPPEWTGLIPGSDRLGKLLSSGIAGIPYDKYLHWDQLRYRTPPGDFTVEEWWVAKKLARSSSWRALPFLDKDGRPFVFGVTDNILEMLHKVDSDTRGSIDAAPEVVANPHTRDRYLINSLFEEAITSSQLEGASTTYKAAKEMLRIGRKPLDRSERMIANNYRAMEFVREVAGQPLNPDTILELHRIVTDDTLDDSTAVGRWRNPGENILVTDGRDNTVLHVPPDAAELPERIQLLCDFANGIIPETGFLHPVIRAIMIHFMVGYDHPFADGNGRTARALFYWSMVRSGYWLIEFLSISTILRKAPVQYARAYLYSESDDNDTTYFLDYNLRVLLRSIDALHRYIHRKTRELREVEQRLTSSEIQHLLNHRQIAILGHALKDPGDTYSIKSHMKSHNVTYQTARVDLLRLVELGFLTQMRRGKAFLFRAVPDLGNRLRSMPVG